MMTRMGSNHWHDCSQKGSLVNKSAPERPNNNSASKDDETGIVYIIMYYCLFSSKVKKKMHIPPLSQTHNQHNAGCVKLSWTRLSPCVLFLISAHLCAVNSISWLSLFTSTNVMPLHPLSTNHRVAVNTHSDSSLGCFQLSFRDASSPPAPRWDSEPRPSELIPDSAARLIHSTRVKDATPGRAFIGQQVIPTVD